MLFGLLGSVEAGGDGGRGFHNYVEYNIEAEALGYYSSFLVERARLERICVALNQEC